MDICGPGHHDDEQYEANLDYEQEGLGFYVHAYHKFHLHFICTYVVYVISISNYLVIKLLLRKCNSSKLILNDTAMYGAAAAAGKGMAAARYAPYGRLRLSDRGVLLRPVVNANLEPAVFLEGARGADRLLEDQIVHLFRHVLRRIRLNGQP